MIQSITMNGPHVPYSRKPVLLPNGQIGSAIDGEVLVKLSRLFAPTPNEIRVMLGDFAQRLKWPRSAVAAFLGVPVVTVRKWERGERNPCAAARKLIWLLHRLSFPTDKKFTTGLGVTLWGRGDVSA